MEIHQLGAIDYTPGGVVSEATNLPYTPGGVVNPNPFAIPTGGGMITLPTDTTAGPAVGGGAAPDLKEDKGAQFPEVKLTPEAQKQLDENIRKEKAKKKNMILLGIGGLVLAYLLLRKK